MRAIIRWLCVISLAVSAVAATPPNIILITLDTTRADRMGFLGSKSGLTPNLDGLAQQSAVFTRAYSQAPLTTVSHATILTGTYPQYHQVNDFRVPLVKDLPYAPEILHTQGYHTAAFVGSIVLNPTPSYAPGFDRGFDTYDAAFHYAGPGENHYRTVERRGGEVVAHALAWLNKHPKGPFFLWVHLYDAHDPYDPPEPYKTRYAKAPYDGEIAYADSALGKLFRQLKASGLYDGSVIAVMADHGESLGAHGEDTHGVFLYDETIHVPLVIKLPKAKARKTIDHRVELVDVMPTLLQATGIAVPAEVQGESLLSMMQANVGESTPEAWQDRPAYSRSDYPRLAFGWSAIQSLRTGKYLYVQSPRRELYDQAADSNAEHNLATTSTAVADTLAERADAFLQKTSSNREAPKAIVDPAAEAKLAALGYVASGSNVTKATGGEQPDPKDKIEIANLIHRASAAREQGKYQEAADLLRQSISKDPSMPGTYAKMGENLLDLKQYDAAVPALRKAAELNPESPMEHVQLAKGLMATGDFAAAVPELEFALTKQPNLADAHIFLEMAYARTNRIPETIKECETVLEFMPDHYGSYLILGRFLELSGDLAGAVAKLKKAASLQPKAPDPHLILSDVYDRLGQKADADRERAEANRLRTHAGPPKI
jgi:arylsulfatase A-like enzyme/Tfp pilus assembly protein PilF